MIYNRILLFLVCLPFLSNSQISKGYQELVSDENPDFSKYETLMYEASEYLMTHPINRNSKEFMAAINVIDYWKDQDTGVNIPIFGNFYKALPDKSPHRYFYMVAMINHVLTEKLQNNRVLKCVKIEGQKYSEQVDVREVQLEGAKIFLGFASDQNNRLPLNSKSKKFLKACKKGKLSKIFFDS